MLSDSKLATPGFFLKLSNYLIPVSLVLGGLCFFLGLLFALWLSPEDYQQGHAVRLMYVHVPAAWMSLLIYVFMAGNAFFSLVYKHVLADVYIEMSASLGALFTFICLITGAIWGKPMWGTWWVWDARLTSVLILFIIYVSYIQMIHFFDNKRQGLFVGNVLILFGTVMLPIIKYSVDWWYTLHQPASVFRLGGPRLPLEMLIPLFLMLGGFICYFILMFSLKVRTVLMQRKRRDDRGPSC